MIQLLPMFHFIMPNLLLNEDTVYMPYQQSSLGKRLQMHHAEHHQLYTTPYLIPNITHMIILKTSYQPPAAALYSVFRHTSMTAKDKKIWMKKSFSNAHKVGSSLISALQSQLLSTTPVENPIDLGIQGLLKIFCITFQICIRISCLHSS